MPASLRIRFFTAALLLGAPATGSLAAPITVPTGLNPGDEYRLAFVTSTVRDALSPNIADYDAHVASAALAVPELASLGTSWQVIGSTLSIDARDHTGTNPFVDGIGVPIYLLNGQRIAANNADLWDGVIENPLQIHEDGTVADRANFASGPFVFTGTAFNGGLVFAFGQGPSPLGCLSCITIPAGLFDATDDFWIATIGGAGRAGNPTPFYGISGVLTVPEPGTTVLLTVAFVSLLLVRRVRAS